MFSIYPAELTTVGAGHGVIARQKDFIAGNLLYSFDFFQALVPHNHYIP